MFENTFFRNVVLICAILTIKNPIPFVRFSYQEIDFSFLALFSFFMAFTSIISSKMRHFIDSEHFHFGRLGYQQLKVQSMAVEMIST